MASRSKRFLAGLTAGYGSILTNVVFTLVSVPLALKYLDRERFALWALAVNVNGYLTLLDMGMSDALSRLIADHKDQVNGKLYGDHLMTGALVFLFQGVIIVLLGIGISFFTFLIPSIPKHLQAEFQSLIVILSLITGVSVALRAIGAPLWCFQRNDVIYGCSSVGFLISLGMLWVGFQLDFGVISFAIAQVPTLCMTLVTYFIICRKNSYYPMWENIGRPSLKIFREMFALGRDSLLVTLGVQIINATPVFVITGWLSLRDITTYNVGAKFYLLALQLVASPISASASGLAEIWVRNEKRKFIDRYWDLIFFVLSISTIAATGLAFCNSSLVGLWTNGEVSWNTRDDMLLGIMVVIYTMSGCLLGMNGLVKNWRAVRYVTISEAVIFWIFSVSLAKFFGITGVLISSIIAHVTLTAVLAARTATAIIGSPIRIYKHIFMSLIWIILVSKFSVHFQNIGISPLGILFIGAGATIVSAVYVWFFCASDHLRVIIKNRADLFLSRKFGS